MTVSFAGRRRLRSPVAGLCAGAIGASLLLASCADGDRPGGATSAGPPGSAVSTAQTPAPGGPGGAGDASRAAPSTTTPRVSAQVDTTATAHATADTCVTHVLAGLSLKQRVGQLFVVGIPSGTTGRAAAFHAARDVSAGAYIVYGHWTRGVTPLRGMVTRINTSLAGRADGVRPLVAADQEGGAVQPLRGKGFDRIPSALAQGKLAPSELRTVWQTNWAKDLRRAGVTVNFAPVADVVPAALGTRNQPIGLHRREFGHTSATVASHATAALTGMQAAGVMSTAKHFPGLGRVRQNTDSAADVTDRTTTPDDPYLRPFRAAVEAGTTFVMVSSATYTKIDPKRKAVYSPVVMRLLREDLGFDGVIVSDDLGAAKQVSGAPYGQRALRFLAAGGQLVVVVGPPRAVRSMAAGVLAQAKRSATVRARVDAAATAVLTVKRAHGLIPGSACS